MFLTIAKWISNQYQHVGNYISLYIHTLPRDLQTQSQVIAISSYFTVDFLHPFNRNPCVATQFSTQKPQAANPFGNSLKPVAGSMTKPVRKKSCRCQEIWYMFAGQRWQKKLCMNVFKQCYLNVYIYMYSIELQVSVFFLFVKCPAMIVYVFFHMHFCIYPMHCMDAAHIHRRGHTGKSIWTMLLGSQEAANQDHWDEYMNYVCIMYTHMVHVWYICTYMNG